MFTFIFILNIGNMLLHVMCCSAAVTLNTSQETADCHSHAFKISVNLKDFKLRKYIKQIERKWI